MAFKINNPLTYINPGKGVKVNVGDFGSKVAKEPAKQSGPDKIGMNVRGSKGYEKALANYKKEVKSNPSVTPKIDTQSSGKQQFDKAISTFKKAASLTSGIGSGKASSVKYPEKPKKTGGYVKKGGTSTGNIKDYKAGTEARRNEYTTRGWKQDSTTSTPPKDRKQKTKASGRQSELSQTSLGKKGKQKKFGDEVTMQSTRNNKKSTPKENTLDAINKVSMKKFVPASKKTTTVKAAPKDNSRKAIRKRKTEDKAAGVSKSQMRANKAKSKSEAALAKAKASKNPSFRAQLKRKSDRLAKRAERKG